MFGAQRMVLAFLLASGCAAAGDSGRSRNVADAAIDATIDAVMNGQPDAFRPVPDGGAPVDCDERARWVYTLDRNGTLTR